jgi:hypothetical protein
MPVIELIPEAHGRIGVIVIPDKGVGLFFLLVNFGASIFTE